jgi:glycosyltransferase involved in cell wall biosynthesis
MSSIRTLVLYTADVWGSACPTLRVTGPAHQLGWQVIQGNKWQPQPQRLVSFSVEVIADADIVIIQRDFPRYAQAYEQVMMAARAAGKPMVYELDDILIETPPDHPFAWYYDPTRFRLLRAVLEADAVTVSTEALRDYVRPINPNVHWLPNCLNEQLWSVDGTERPQRIGPPPVIVGYMGGHTHAPDVATMLPVFQQLLDRYGDGLQLSFFGSTPPPPELQSDPRVQWDRFDRVDYAEFAAYFSRVTCDIFIAPLLDHVFNRFKSAIKFIEYSALGVPGVYSRITAYEAVIRHGENGLLAISPAEWEECLTRLIDSPELRARMGRCAQETTRQDWSLARWAPEWQRVYEAVQPDQHITLPSPAQRAWTRADAWWQTEIARLYAAITSQQETERRAEQQVAAVRDQLYQRERDLEFIRNSPGWQLLQAMWPLRLWLAPIGSRRERAALNLIAGLRRFITRHN